MAAFAASPRKGHLEAVYHIFAYLKRHDRSRLVFDASYPNNVEEKLPDWTEFYKYAKEEIPKDIPEPLGNPVEMTAYMDSNHAGDKVSRRSQTGVLIFLNRSPIIWHNMKQSSIETSSFGSEFSAMKTGTELNFLRSSLQTSNDESSNRWTLPRQGRQSFSCSQQQPARINSQEEVQFHSLSLCPRASSGASY